MFFCKFSFCLFLNILLCFIANNSSAGILYPYSKDNLLLQQDKEPDSVNYWRKGGTLRINFRTVSLTNWNQGGTDFISGGTDLRLFANYEKNNFVWISKFSGEFSLIRRDDDLLNRLVPDNDRFQITLDFSRKLRENFLATATLDFRSQFYQSRKYRKVKVDTVETVIGILTNEFMAPAYLRPSVGFTLRLKSDNTNQIVLSPLSGKFTFVLNDSLSNIGAFGVEDSTKIRPEVGPGLELLIRQKLMENVTYNTELSLFSAYNNIFTIDVDWKNLLSFKVNRYITSSIQTHLIYDEDILILKDKDRNINNAKRKPAIQFRYELNLGFMLDFTKK
jgi:hypothetical protein